jgi:hypothetical protein
MHTTGVSFKAIGRQMGYHYSVVSRLVRKHTKTNNVKDLPRSDRPRVTSDRAKHHAKRDRRCQSANSGYLITLLDLRPADIRRFLTVFVDKRILGSQCCLSTGLVANGIRLIKRCNTRSVMVWECISHDCKLDLVTIQGNLTGDQYIRDVLQPVVVPHFDNYPLATRPAVQKAR